MARILIVDDFKTQQAFLSSIVKENGFDVLTAKNGKQALDLLSIESVDLVLTDYEMPEMNGFDLLKSIRQSVSLKKLPVIMISSNTEIQKEAEAQGLTAFIKKPFDQTTVTKHIFEALGKTNSVQMYRVLLLDDVSIQTDIWAKILEMPAFIYDKVHNAQEALNKLRAETYHAILTDYLMPRVDGERFIRKIKSMPEFKHIPIFVITSHQDLLETGIPGAEKILLKPFNPRELKQLIKEAVTSLK